MFVYQLFEGEPKRVIVVYPGRFQPFHLGHKEVFEALQAKFGMDNVYIGTSNKVDLPKSPFNFSEKLQLINAAGVTSNHVVEVTNPYIPTDYINRIGFDPSQTIMIFAVGEPDLKRLEVDAHYTEKTPTGRPSKIPPGKQVGDPKPLKSFRDMSECVTADQHQYVMIAKERPKTISVDGQQYDASHGTQVRELWNQVRNDPKASAQVMQQLYGRATAEIAHILNKIPDSNAPAEPAPKPSPKLKAVPKPEVNEAGYGRNRGYNYGFASPTAPSLGGRREREDDEGWDREEQERQATWYIRINGKIVKDKMGVPYQFRGREAAVKAARTMMAKPFNAGKQFTLSTSPTDREQGMNEFAPPNSNDGGDDGFSEETLKRLAAQWYNGDEDPRVERTLMAAGWEIGQDEGYDDEPGVFVVQSGDVNGNSYMSWPAHELKQGMAEGTQTVGHEILGMLRQVKRQGDDAMEELYSSSPLLAQFWDQYEGDFRSMVIELSPKTLNRIKAEIAAFNQQGVAESKYKCTCHPGDPDPDCPVHGLEPMEVGDALDVKLDEKWSQKYKRSINCSHPRGFSQRAHCAGRKKNEAAEMTNVCPDCGWSKEGLSEAKAATAAFRAGNKKRAELNAMSDEERKAYDKQQQEKQRKRDDARLERERQKLASKKGVAEGLNEFAPAGGGGNIPRGPKTPSRGPWGDSGEDPYQLRRYNRSIDFFDQFDSDGVDKQNFDKATGEYEGYYFDRDAASGITQIAYFKFDDPTKIGDNDPGVGWYYEPIDEGVAEGNKGISRDAETKFHAKLDALVHDTFGKRKSEKGMKEEAAGVGVVASKKQAKDPRYSMSLTKDVRPGQVNKSLKAFNLAENAEELNVGDPVIITGNVEFQGKTGDIDSFGDMKRFVIVNLYNHGKHSFHSSDVSYNDYANEHDIDEDMYQYDKADPYNSEFAPRAGMGRMTLRGWKQQMIKRTAELAQAMADAGQDIDKAALWDHVYKKLKSMNMDPIAQEIELAQAELEKIRSRGGIRSRAFNK